MMAFGSIGIHRLFNSHTHTYSMALPQGVKVVMIFIGVGDQLD